MRLYRRPSPLLWRRMVAWIHVRILMPISNLYSRWTGEPNLPQEGIFWLPFNLVLKYSSRARLDEARAMSYAHSLGLPAPKALSYGEHVPFFAMKPFTNPWGSIIMTRLPGQRLNEVLGSLDSQQIDNIRRELDTYLTILRRPRSPWGPRVCSISGGVVCGVCT